MGTLATSKLLNKLRRSCAEHAIERKISELLDQVLALIA